MASNRIIVAPNGTAGAILGSYDIFGTNAGAETVTVYNSTTAAFQGDFARGGDTIRLFDVASDFTIRLAGSSAELFSVSDGISVTVPIGIAGVSIRFLTGSNVFDDVRILKFDGTNVVLGTQVVTGDALAVTPTPSQSSASLGFGGESYEIIPGDAALFGGGSVQTTPDWSSSLEQLSSTGGGNSVALSSHMHLISTVVAFA